MSTMTMEGMQRVSDLLRVKEQLGLIVELGEWVCGIRTQVPDLRKLSSALTAQTLERKKANLEEWQDIFGQSLDAFKDMVEMDAQDWVSLTSSDLEDLEYAIKVATDGIVAWVQAPGG